MLRELFSQALPIMFSMFFIGVGIFNILYFIGQFGELATAGYGAALRVEQVFLLPVIGLNYCCTFYWWTKFWCKKI